MFYNIWRCKLFAQPFNNKNQLRWEHKSKKARKILKKKSLVIVHSNCLGKNVCNEFIQNFHIAHCFNIPQPSKDGLLKNFMIMTLLLSSDCYWLTKGGSGWANKCYILQRKITEEKAFDLITLELIKICLYLLLLLGDLLLHQSFSA